MNLLITGASGFIGSVLTPYLLSQGHHIRVLDSFRYGGEGLLPVWSHPNLTILPVDIRDQVACQQALEDMDAVVHLAALVGAPLCDQDPSETLDVNFTSTVRLAYDARLARVPLFLFASTASVYGCVPRGQVCNEESTRQSVSLYARTKIDAEDKVLETASWGHYLPLILRFGTAYGLSGRMRFDTLINQFALEAHRDKHLLIYQPNAMRPYCHVRDIARAIQRLLAWAASIMRRGILNRDMSTVFNVGGHNRSKRDIADWLQDRIEGLEVEYVEQPGVDLRDYAVDWANSNMARLSWAPCYCPEMGLEEVLKALDLGVFTDTEEARWRNV